MLSMLMDLPFSSAQSNSQKNKNKKHMAGRIISAEICMQQRKKKTTVWINNIAKWMQLITKSTLICAAQTRKQGRTKRSRVKSRDKQRDEQVDGMQVAVQVTFNQWYDKY